jgi:hypothetical protein
MSISHRLSNSRQTALVDTMVQTKRGFFGGHEFDDFLFATVWKEENGMLLSVQSALARLDVDPWQEAACLSHLKPEIAAGELARLIASLPEFGLVDRDSTSIAHRLIGLLPRAAESSVARKPSSAVGRNAIVILAVLAIVALGAQWYASDRRPQPREDGARPATMSTPIPDRVDG